MANLALIDVRSAAVTFASDRTLLTHMATCDREGEGSIEKINLLAAWAVKRALLQERAQARGVVADGRAERG